MMRTSDIEEDRRPVTGTTSPSTRQHFSLFVVIPQHHMTPGGGEVGGRGGMWAHMFTLTATIRSDENSISSSADSLTGKDLLHAADRLRLPRASRGGSVTSPETGGAGEEEQLFSADVVPSQ